MKFLVKRPSDRRGKGSTSRRHSPPVPRKGESSWHGPMAWLPAFYQRPVHYAYRARNRASCSSPQVTEGMR
jgi:hypothetical protein